MRNGNRTERTSMGSILISMSMHFCVALTPRTIITAFYTHIKIKSARTGRHEILADTKESKQYLKRKAQSSVNGRRKRY